MDRLRAYAQLLRLPNVFTAWADVLMGWLVVCAWEVFHPQLGGEVVRTGEHRWEHLLVLAFLLLASSSLYCAGMVLNDVFDLEEDRRDRPFRPIPSGRISRRAATLLGVVLLFLGVVASTGAELLGAWLPSLLSVWLVISIVGYDAWLKRTWLGPLGMGVCRFLNVLLGLSAAGTWPTIQGLYLAGVVGLYILGVTWFARTEATISKQGSLLDAASVIGVASMGALILGGWVLDIARLFEYHPESLLYPGLLLVWAGFLGKPLDAAVNEPTPQRVQAAVKTCILGLIGLDALLAFCVVGWPGLLILLLLPPALLLGRWVYST
jgi:4-hydroxybenzoate polyprenyltransferase